MKQRTRRLPAIALVAVALLALPASAPAQDAPAPATPRGGGWSAADLVTEVDMAAFAAEHRAEFQASSWAAAGDAAAADRARAFLTSAYTGATTGTGFAQQEGAEAHQYTDECDDGSNLPLNGIQPPADLEGIFRPPPAPDDPATGQPYSYNPDPASPAPRLDLRSVFLAQTTDSGGRPDQTGFLGYTCETWTRDQLGAGGLTFGLYVSYETGDTQYPTILGDAPELGPDFIVSIFHEPNVPERTLQIMAIRTPTRDHSTWTLTWLDEADRIDAFEVDGVVPTSAIGDTAADDGFAFTVEVVDHQLPAGGRDWFPERNMQLPDEDFTYGVHIPQFPIPADCTAGTRQDRYTLQQAQVTPNDDGYRFQWHMPAIRAPQAWSTILDSSTGGRVRPVTVAVIDSGIDGPRNDFNAPPRVTPGVDAVYSFELEGFPDPVAAPVYDPLSRGGVGYADLGPQPRNSDRGPHGTAVAGLIGALGNNVAGLAGVDWGARLMPVRVNDVNGCIFNDVVAAGVVWAVDHGADIVNVSLVGELPEGDPTRIVELDPPRCSDGVDNDNDGETDLADPGCENDPDGDTEVGEEENAEPVDGGPGPNCNDEVDNDGDGVIDEDDPGCEPGQDTSVEEDTSELFDEERDPPRCSDGFDNDRDGFVDFPDDPHCGSAMDISELPLELRTEELDPNDLPNCDDGFDNDGDGLVDEEDDGCEDADDESELEASGTFDPLRVAVDYALEQGVAVVASAGNFGGLEDPFLVPAGYPGVITVGATARNGRVAQYSSTGRWLDLVAPGGSNDGSLANNVPVLWELERIELVAGTSFAAPLVTGALSLYLGLNPQIERVFDAVDDPDDPNDGPQADLGYQRTVDDLFVATINAGRDIAPAGHDVASGFGLLDVDRMLDIPALGGPLVDPARAQLPRINVDEVVQIAENVAAALPPAPFVTFTRSDVFADALAAAPLAGGGPLLLTEGDGLPADWQATLSSALQPGGRIYLLGGEAAISPEVEATLRGAGHDVVRLAGADRVGTALAVAREVRSLWPGGTTVALARADGGSNATAGWVDSVSGGAWAAQSHTPVLITGSGGLHPDVAAALSEWGIQETVLLGGEAALSPAVEAAVPGARRVAGADRAATAAAVATELWGAQAGEGYVIVNGYYARGWAPAMAAASLAAAFDRPLLLTGASTVPGETAALLGSACPDPASLHLIGGAAFITGSAETALMEAASC